MNRGQYYTPVITAFNPDGSLDIESNRRVWDNLIKGGVSGIVVMGSTGEFFAMTPEQKKTLIDEAASYLKGRTKLFVGTGNMRMGDTVELSNHAFQKGADGVMIIGPYYFSLSDESIEAYFCEVAKQVNGNIFLYNFPERTSYDLKPSIALKLAKAHKNIVGYKDTVGSMSHTRQLIVTLRGGGCDDFTILSGKDENFAHTILSGGDGCIGGYSNLYPDLAGAMVKAVDAKDMAKVSALQKIVDIVNEFDKIGMPFIPILKRAMQLRGIALANDTCQFPFLSATKTQEAAIQTLLDQVEPMVKATV